MNRRRLLWAALAVLMAIAVSSCSNEQKAPQAPERPYIPQVYTAAGLQEAVKSGGAVKLGSDVTITVPAQTEGGLPTAAMEITRDTTINLNGKTLRVVQAPASKGASKISSGPGSVEDRDPSGPTARIEASAPMEDMYVLEVTSGTLTISGSGMIDGSGMKGIRVGDGTPDCSAHLVINGGEVRGEYVAVHLNGGNVAADISGGKFSVQNDWNGKYYVLNIQDKYAGKAKYNVTGGTFEGFNPMSHSNDTENDNYVADGYYTEYDDGNKTYTVKQRPSGTAGYKVVWDQDGLNAITDKKGDQTTGILLGADIELNPEEVNHDAFLLLSEESEVTLDLNGHKLTATANSKGQSKTPTSFIAVVNSKLTIKDSSNGNGQIGDTGKTGYMAVWVYSDSGKQSSVTIENGKFFGEMVAVYLQGKNSVGIISGGEFKTYSKYGSPETERYWTINIMNGDAMQKGEEEKGTHYSVTGGRFYEFDPSEPNTDDNESYVADGYHSEQDGDWYVVIPGAASN